MTWVATAVVGAAVVGGAVQHDAAKSAGRASERAASAGIESQNAALDSFNERTQQFVDLGGQAGDEISNLIGLNGGNQLSQLDEINPLVSFLRDQGFEDIQESAAAGGRLGAGGTLEDLTQFNTDLASTVVPQLQSQRFNQLATILGIGGNAATGQGNAALSTGANVANLQGNIGTARGSAAVGKSNAITNTLGNLSGAFGATRGGGTTPTNQPFTNDIGGVQNPNSFEGFA